MTTPILTKPEVDAMYVECHKGLSIDRHKFADLLTVAVLAKLAAMNEPVASIYVSAGGAREFDDWRVPLPEGRNELFTHPPAAQDREDAERWRAVRDHWKSAQMRFRKDASNLLRSITLTVDFDHRSSGAREIEREFDAALKGTP